ncbi:MAG TPA: GNAT family N-acetyltransferase [Saprospiraceae bacterium]|nr:GNAT family N-acetyltransferase [Saprospiraceae bacterium]
MISNFIVPIEFASPAFDEALRLRYLVLREPLKLEYTPEQIEEESEQFHFGFFTTIDRLAGVLTMQAINLEIVKMRQVAIDESCQKMGFGSQLVQYAEVWAKVAGYKKIELHARDLAKPFYDRLEYLTEGEPFEEVSIKHYAMFKNL